MRKLGGITVRSIGQVAKLQTIKDNNEDYVPPREMLRELMEDNKHMAAAMRKAHKLADDHEDSGTAGLLETFIDETERRTWFLFEASRAGRQQRGVGPTPLCKKKSRRGKSEAGAWARPPIRNSTEPIFRLLSASS